MKSLKRLSLESSFLSVSHMLFYPRLHLPFSKCGVSYFKTQTSSLAPRFSFEKRLLTRMLKGKFVSHMVPTKPHLLTATILEQVPVEIECLVQLEPSQRSDDSKLAGKNTWKVGPFKSINRSGTNARLCLSNTSFQSITSNRDE